MLESLFDKNETTPQVFVCDYCEILKNTFFTEHVKWLLLKLCSIFKWQQWYSNPQSLSSEMNTHPFSPTGQMIELYCEYVPVGCIWLYVIIMSRTRFKVNLRTNWFWVRIPLLSLKLQISRLFWARSSLTFRQPAYSMFHLVYIWQRTCKIKNTWFVRWIDVIYSSLHLNRQTNKKYSTIKFLIIEFINYKQTKTRFAMITQHQHPFLS